MNYEDYKAKFTAWAALTEQRLGELCDEFLPPHEEIAKAARYSLLGGGKRIRAVLALAACELSGTAPEKALDYACALEMLHCYSAAAALAATSSLANPRPCWRRMLWSPPHLRSSPTPTCPPRAG